MTQKKNQTPLEIINGSGYLFQLTVENEIKQTEGLHSWSVLSREYPWRDNESGKEGFIDLILQNNNRRILIECKRPREATWLFIVSEKAKNDEKSARCRWTKRDTRTGSDDAGYDDFHIYPSTPEAEFCSVHGSGEEQKGTLERLSDTLLLAIESFAAEEFRFLGAQRTNIHLPFIVTTADLLMYQFNPEEVPLKTGVLKEGSAFQPVPYIRFRKSLTTKYSKKSAPKDLDESRRDKERTVFVVNAASLEKLLQQLSISEY